MTYGSPSHRLESQLSATAQVLEVDAQFVHLPTVVIASFGDTDTHTSETHFVKAGGGLDLGKLHQVHQIYRQVVHDEASVQEGSAALSRLLKSPPIYKIWQRMIFAAICAGTIAPIGFGGSFVDAWVAAAFGAMLSFLQLYVVRKSAGYSNIFEISVATVTSFIARGLSTTQYFCYPALASSGVVLILPGYAILCGSLELATKNIVTGSVRMVYAIIYSLFLGFGIAVGSDLYFLLDPSARNIACARNPDWQWWRQNISPYALIALVPIFSLFLCLNNLQPIRSKQLPVMIIIACIGFVTNTIANRYIFDHSDIVSFIGSFVVGILGNLYSRIFRGTGFVVMVPGVLFLVPSGIAAAGGLAMTQVKGRGDSYSNGLIIGFRMVQVAIGITVGLFFSSFIVYSFGRRKQAALFAF
ncbi:DUF1212-domain-containing protein [Cystobasidium minutum MCA 4210]|uniref:DUF1212-domain-containing protein n=1 Tax=Cystobasidium minutum MCA 4210 TaxID=1397322 RepID=UPI0034CE984D|eukprot:jgi/Rhomi1/183544/fgenesh1_pm.4_\